MGRVYLLLLAAGLLMGGCVSGRADMTSFSSRAAAGAEAMSLDRIEARLTALGYEIERRDPREGLVVANSTEMPAKEAGVGVSSRARVRRSAEVRVSEAGGEPRVYCKVMLQERATQGHRLLAQERRSSDRPGDITAIDRDAATTTQQNTVWLNLRRDRSAEREILEAIVPTQGQSTSG